MLWILAVSGLAFFLRFFWLIDMEFKGDEKSSVLFIRHLEQADFSPLAPIAGHSGFAHSSGFYYLVHWVSLGSSNPLIMASAVAGLNAVAIVILVLLCRKSKVAQLLGLMCATSFSLVLASRKIWTPDLVAAWVILSIGLFLFGRARKTGWLAWTAVALSSAAVLISGHMYLPGISVAIGMISGIAACLFFQKEKSLLRAWLAGLVLGGLTWVPYAYLLMTHAPGAFAPDPLIMKSSQAPFQWAFLVESLRVAASLPSPYQAAETYIFQAYDAIKAITPSWLFSSLTFLLSWLTALWITIYLASFARLWQRRRDAIREPLLWASFSAIIFTVIALQILKLGYWHHYWFGTIPFAYYLIAWASGTEGEKNNNSWFARGLRYSIYLGVLGSTLAVLLFFGLVRLTGGPPYEYQQSYRAQLLTHEVIP